MRFALDAFHADPSDASPIIAQSKEFEKMSTSREEETSGDGCHCVRIAVGTVWDEAMCPETSYEDPACECE